MASEELLASMRALLDEKLEGFKGEIKDLSEKLAEVQAHVAALRDRPRVSVFESLGLDASNQGASQTAGGADASADPSGVAAPKAFEGGSLVSEDLVSSFDLSTAAASWDGHKEIKLKELPRLGRNKDELPYGRWKMHVLADLDAARLTPVLCVDFPGSASIEVQGYYRAANAVLFAGLLHAVKGISVLSDIVLRLYGQPSSARDAWRAIKAFFVRVSSNARMHLLAKLDALEPRDGESMEAFLNRCELLRNEFAEHGLKCEDSLLTSQVLRKLSIQWKSRAGLDRPLDVVPWSEVAQALQDEDNSRRQSNTKSPEALLPLGWTRRSGEARAATGGDSPGKQRPALKGPGSSSGDASAAPASAPPKGHAPKGAIPQGERKVSVPVVCWYCQKVGHLWGECNTKPAGWKPGAEDKAKADATREEMRRRRAQSEKDKAAHAARVAALKESPTDARCSADL